jgi:hypothetical protein
MALDPGSAVGQAETANDTLAGFFSDLNKFVRDLTGATLPPEFSDLVDSLDYSELLRMTTSRVSDAASFENGAAIENVHLMVAIVREYNLRSKSKLDYYNDAQSDYLSESTYYSAAKVFWVNMISGLYDSGKTI